MTDPQGFDVDEFLSDYKPRSISLDVCSRADLLDEHARLEQSVLSRSQSETLRDPDLERIRARLVEIEREMSEASRTFTFQALSARRWQDLIRAHPPSKAQIAQHGPGLDHDPDRFPIAAVAASSLAPKLTEDQVLRLADMLPHGEWTRIWSAVREVNMDGVTVPKALVVGLIDAAFQSVGSSTTAPLEGSPGASS